MPPGRKEDWHFAPASSKGKPQFEDVDNPGRWNCCTFKARFTSRGVSGKYNYYQMPAGAQVVPNDATAGKHSDRDFEFSYKVWKQTRDNPSPVRQGTRRENMFPANHKAKLDAPLREPIGQMQVVCV